MRLIRGAPGSGKTALVFREFKQAVAAGRTDLRIVVPTATLVRHFQHELARDGMVVSPHMVVSLNRFVRERAPDAAAAPDLILRLLVRDALRRLHPAEFSSVAATEGMADVIVESIRLLENAGCEAKRFAAIRGLGSLAKALGRIWLDVDAGLSARGFVSRPELLARAAKNDAKLTLWLDGFVTLSPIERDFLGSIGQKCDLTITALDDRQDDVLRWAMQNGARDTLLRGNTRAPERLSVEALSLEREADEIARRIVELRKTRTEYREIGVAIRDVATYRPLLEAAFERFGIPSRFYFSRPLRSHPAAIVLSGIIRAACAGWPFEETLDALQAHPGLSGSAAFDRFDFKVREAMPGRGSRNLVELVEDDWLRRKLEVCFGIEAWTAQRRTPAAWNEEIAAWAAAVYRPGRAEAPGDSRELIRLRSHASGLRAWLDAVESALPFWGGGAEKITLSEFWTVAGDAIDFASVSTPDDRRDVVHVVNALEARQWNVSELFVCGLTDRDYPRKYPQHLLFAQSDIDKLAREGFRIRTAKDQDAEDIRLFDSLASRASDVLVMSWPRHDAAGHGVTRSQFASEAPVRAVACAPATVRVVSRARGVGRISSAALLAELAARHQQISVTHIESLAQCAFQFFARRTMRLDARPERPQERINAREKGLILHQTLELWLKDRTQNFAELFEQAFEQACAERHLPRGFRLEVERFVLRDIARQVSEASMWPVTHSEAEVDVSLPLIDGVMMTGRVDRVDHIGGGDCVLIDYKSKGQAGMKKLVESETALQGPLYALALRRKLGLNTVGMVYWAVREGRLYGWGDIPGYSGKQPLEPIPPDWEANAWSRAAGRLSAYLAGDIAPAPTHEEDCRFCDARACCRVEERQGLVMIEVGA